jgi:hypothetical protein
MKNKLIKCIAAATILTVMFGANQAFAGGIDIFVVYSGEDKAINKAVKGALKESYQVKSYNVDLLALADYTGKQKVTSKISKAKLVVFVKSEARATIGEKGISNFLEVQDGSPETITRIKSAL